MRQPAADPHSADARRATFRPPSPGPVRALIASLAALFAGFAPAAAEPTDISVRVIARGAKFVGSGMGGARIVIRDAATGELLSAGVAEGGTGDTARIMTDKTDRNGARWTSGAAEFRTRIDLDAPRKVWIEAMGPLAQPQASLRAGTEAWLLPGRNVVEGDAFLIELPGFAVDVLAPAAHSAAAGEVAIEANVVMMCGCPLTSGGMWDADAYEVRATVRREGEVVADFPLDYAGAPSRFSGRFRADPAGVYTIAVHAFDPANGNAGVDHTSVIISD